MQKRQFTYENLLYILAFALALAVRLLNLGKHPLSDFEAGWALQAWDLGLGQLAVPGPQPGYLSLTSIFFAVFGSNDAMARLWPAIAGSLMVLSPLAFGEKLGRKAALILAFALALDPGLVALSRQAGSPIVAISFIVLTIGLAYQRKPAWSGICFGLALLGGPAVWLGLLGLGIAWLLSRLAGVSLETRIPESGEPPQPPVEFIRKWMLFTVGTILIVSTRFFTYPAGIGAWAESLGEFLRAWVQPSAVPALRLLVATVAYQPLMIIFAIVAVFLTWKRDRAFTMGLGLWGLVTLGLAMAYPGRQVGDVAWMLVPLWILAAKALADCFDNWIKNPIALAQAGAIVVLLALTWITLSGLRFALEESRNLRLLIILGIVALAGLSTAFVGLGWSWKIARAGAVLGIVASFSIYGISTMMSATQIRPNSPAELWSPTPGTGQAQLLVDSLRDLSLFYAGEESSLEMTSLIDSTSLRWALKDFSAVSYATALGDGILPPVVIADPGSENLPWSATYRGQDFPWELHPGWDGVLPVNWVDWLVLRKVPLQKDMIILWARSDLFPEDLVTSDEAVEDEEIQVDDVE